MIPSDFFFGNGSAAYLFLLLPLFFLLFIALFHYRRRALLQFPSNVTPRSSLIYWAKSFAFILGLGSAIIALMEPQGNGHYPEEGKRETETQQVRSQEILFLIDSSASMGVKDSRNGMSRLSFAQDIADQLVADLEGQSVSLYAFTSEVTPLSPATMDYLFVRFMLRDMHLNEGDVAGTNIVKAMQELHKTLLAMPPKRMKRLILISDGGDTRLDTLSSSDKEKAIASLLDLFDDARPLNYRIDAIGMGAQKGALIPDVTDEKGNPVYSSLEDELLKRLARRSGGQYLEANSSTAPAIADQLMAAIREDATHAPVESFTSGSGKIVSYEQYFQIPLGVTLLLLMFIIAWPDTRVKV